MKMSNHHSNEQEGKVRHEPDTLKNIFNGIIIIWLGVSLFFMKQDFFHAEWWACFLLGLGLIFIIEAFLRMRLAAYEKPYMGKLIAGIVLVGVGASNIYDLEDWWPLLLIAVGVVIVLVNLRPRKEN